MHLFLNPDVSRTRYRLASIIDSKLKRLLKIWMLSGRSKMEGSLMFNFDMWLPRGNTAEFTGIMFELHTGGPG